MIRDNQESAVGGQGSRSARSSGNGSSRAESSSGGQSSSQVNPQPSWMGKRVGRFRLLGLLGQGAMGRVFRAEDTMLRRHVALKVLPKTVKRGQRTIDADKLIHEARAAASLEHPHAVQVYEVNEVGGIYYIAMELVEAGSLRDLVEGQGPIDYVRVCQLGAEAAEALGHAHAMGIVHRDVKPANLLLTRTGRVKVADFGLARVEDPSDLTNFLAESVGTPQFVAPEILQGQSATGKSDLYSLGGTLWYLLTGKPPFEAARAEELLHKHINAPLPNLKKLRPDLPDGLVRTICTALAKDPAKRHGTAEQFASALRVHSIPVGDAAGSLAGVSSASLERLAALAAQAERQQADQQPAHAPAPAPQPPAGSGSRWLVPLASLGGAALIAGVVVGAMWFRGALPTMSHAEETAPRTVAIKKAPRVIEPAAPVKDEIPPADAQGQEQQAAATATPEPAPAAIITPAVPRSDPAPAPAAPAPRHDKVVNLMPMIDPAIAGVAGAWRFDNGDLVSDAAKPATLQIPYSPPAEYDVKVEFTADSTVQVHLFKDPASFSWAMGTSHACGFEYVDGRHVWESPFKSNFRLTAGKRHTAVIRIRNNRAQGYIDGQLLVDGVTDFKNFSKNPELAQPDNSRLGIGSYNAPARFHKIEVIEVTPK